jgi:hypothetical protein
MSNEKNVLRFVPEKTPPVKFKGRKYDPLTMEDIRSGYCSIKQAWTACTRSPWADGSGRIKLVYCEPRERYSYRLPKIAIGIWTPRELNDLCEHYMAVRNIQGKIDDVSTPSLLYFPGTALEDWIQSILELLEKEAKVMQVKK